MPKSNCRIYILLPVHNRREVTELFIQSLLNQSHKCYHLILIDDGSTDGTSEVVKKQVRNLTVLNGTGESWWAGSLQIGINWLKKYANPHDVILFINDDVTFSYDFLERGIELLDNKEIMLLAQIYDSNTQQLVESGVQADFERLTFKSATSSALINCLSTRGLFTRFNVLLKVGGFHPKLLPHYLSDYEFTIRAYKLGIPLITDPTLSITFDMNITGSVIKNNLSALDFLRYHFSKKSPNNPIYWSSFVLLTSKKYLIPWLLLIVWLRFMRQIVKELILSKNKFIN